MLQGQEMATSFSSSLTAMSFKERVVNKEKRKAQMTLGHCRCLESGDLTQEQMVAKSLNTDNISGTCRFLSSYFMNELNSRQLSSETKVTSLFSSVPSHQSINTPLNFHILISKMEIIVSIL